MLKKYLAILIVVLCGAITVSAQQKEGRWTLYPSVGDKFAEVVETPDRTFLLSGSSLFSFSADDNESYAYNVFNRLTERNAIKKIAYNYDKGYLFVGYDNGNIDLLYDNGRTVNMPEIRDASLTVSRGILDVDFGHDRIFVATEFGLVVFDDERHLVIESGIYNQSIQHVFVMGDHLLLIHDRFVYASRYDDRHLELSKMRQLPDIWNTDIVKLNDTTLAYNSNNTTNSGVHFRIYDFDTWTETRGESIYLSAFRNLKQDKDGFHAIDKGQVVYFRSDGTVERAALPTEYSEYDVFMSDLSSVWVNTSSGITHLNLSGDTPTVLMQPYKPEALTMSKPFKMYYSKDGSRMYVANTSYSFLHDVGSSDNEDKPDDAHRFIARTCVVENGNVRNVQPNEFPNNSLINSNFYRYQQEDGTPLMDGGTVGLTIDPDDPGMYYVTSLTAGVFVIKDGEYYHNINSTNCPYQQHSSFGFDRIMHVDIDNEGNLWLIQGLDDTSAAPHILMLPAAKRRDIRNIQKSDWTPLPLRTDFFASRDMFTTFLTKSPVNIICRGGWDPTVIFQAHNNTPMLTSDDRLAYHNGYTDQNGNTISPRHVTCAVEDHDGRVWVGMHTGTYVIDSPTDCFGGQLNVRRPIVARNDGTGLGDYLLESAVVYDIAVDAANRKWYATNSGAYLVSEDGTEIIAHYNTDNSPIPSDIVAAVECDPMGNRVYFGTDNGLVCYDSDAAPAAEDYSEVYAYPNPVRPEYTGYITVAGLMDNSLVKIADSAGNVFYQGRSEGGMVSWDGCDMSGRRVKSGVYFVFASQSNDSSSKGAVAKILVIN